MAVPAKPEAAGGTLKVRVLRAALDTCVDKDDEQLAAGLLYGEGIINQAADIEAIESSTRRPNVVNVRLRPRVALEAQMPARRFSAGSSCGVCGTTSLDAAIARAAATRIPATGSVDLRV